MAGRAHGAGAQVIKLPAGKYTVREREMLSGVAGAPESYFMPGNVFSNCIYGGALRTMPPSRASHPIYKSPLAGVGMVAQPARPSMAGERAALQSGVLCRGLLKQAVR